MCGKETAFVLVRHWHWAAGTGTAGSGFIRQQVARQPGADRDTPLKHLKLNGDAEKIGFQTD